jgi:hypothetical protein
MSMGGKHVTKADAARRDAIKAGNCMACDVRGIDVSGQGLVQWHHLLSGGRRRGHRFTIGLCLWHHLRAPLWGHSFDEMTDEYGPSLLDGSKTFHAAFGSDDELLARQDALIGWTDTEAA